MILIQKGCKLSLFPKKFDPSSSVLFLGAGFSRGATNIDGNDIPVGKEFEIAIKSLAGISINDPSSLSDISSYAIESGFDVYDLIRRSFTIRDLSEDQKTILSKKWRRIYTTNYDDSIASYNFGIPSQDRRKIFSNLDDIPNQLRDNTAIHLHGYVRQLDKDNIASQIVLTHRSYADQRNMKVPWWDRFSRDIAVAENIFFVGYDLGDFEAASHLSSNPELADKTHFILIPDKSPVIANRIKPYGKRHEFGVSGFAKECLDAEVRKRPIHANELRSLQFFDIVKDGKLNTKPEPQEIFSLFAYGQFEIRNLLGTFPESTYTLIRNRKIEEVKTFIDESKTVIIHSKTGNGKTLFSKTLLHALTVAGYKCFELKEGTSPTSEEIAYLKEIEEAVVFFPSYDSAYSNIDRFSDIKESARFIVEINSSIVEVRFNETEARLPQPTQRVDLNRLEKSDLQGIRSLLRKAGITLEETRFTIDENVEFRDIVLSIFENKSVLDNIDSIVRPMLADADAKVVIVCSALLKTIGLSTDSGIIRSISNVDAYKALHKNNEASHEIVKFNYDTIEPHSALFSEFLLNHYIQPHELGSAILTLVIEAARRMNESGDPHTERMRAARQMLGGLLRFSLLEQLFSKASNRRTHIKRIYEHARDNVLIQEEPLFWLQYSIFMQNQNNWPLAEEHMKTAYDRALSRVGFKTYQLDTNYLGLCLTLEYNEKNDSSVARLEKIAELLGSCRVMINDGNHRGHTLKVLNDVEKFVSRRLNGMKRSERMFLADVLDLLVSDLERLTPEVRAYFGSDATKRGLLRSSQLLKQ